MITGYRKCNYRHFHKINLMQNYIILKKNATFFHYTITNTYLKA